MTGAADIQTVVFGLDGELFGLPVALVREILDFRDAFRVPEGPDWLTGLIDVRGEVVPMVDLRRRLGLATAEPTVTTRILVVNAIFGDRSLTLGLVVDRVLDVSTFTAAEREPTPDIGVRWNSAHIDGLVRRNGQFVMLLDAGSIFGADATHFDCLPKAA